MQQVAYIIIHNGNILSDFVYIATVQSVNSSMHVVMVAFLFPSIFIVLAFSVYGK